MNWKPLIENSKVKSIFKKLDEISDSLQNVTDRSDNIGLLIGKTGITLFFYYYSKFINEKKYSDYGFEIISAVFNEINSGYSYHTFCAGLAGVGWAVEYFAQNNFLKVDTDEILGELDPYFHKTAINDIQDGKYDFFHGAVGNGVYFLSRLKNKKSKEYLIHFIDELEKQSISDRDGSIKWESVLNHEKGTKGFNLSLSHGIASIIAFLGKMLEKGIYTEKVLYLLKGAVQYLLKQRLDTGKYASNFPSWVFAGDPSYNSRLAWCYGDLGIGIALWQASQSIKNKEWEEQAIKTLLHSTRRKDLEANLVLDAGLCHGTAGIAHIYNRMYHYTGIEAFRKSAIYWIDQTLKMARFDDGFAGYKAWYTEKHGGWKPEGNLLEGIAGIGLALIAAISDIRPGWDRCFLLS